MINDHNAAISNTSSSLRSPKYWQISQSVLYSGYLIKPADTERLLTAANLPLKSTPDGELRTLANCILITPRPMPANLLNQTGPMGKVVRWRINGVGMLDNKVWAARVEPVSKTEKTYTENRPPCVVLALGRNARPQDASRIQQWQTLSSEQGFEFDTTIGEKTLLRLNETTMAPRNSNNVREAAPKRGRSDYNSAFPALGTAGPQQRNENNRPRPGNVGGPQRGFHAGAGRGRANSNQPFRGAGRGGSLRGQNQRGAPYSKPGPGRGGGRGRGDYGMDGTKDDGRGLKY